MKSGKILFADDEPEQLEPLIMLLEREGHTTKVVRSGHELREELRLEYLLGNSVDVVVLDVRMPDESTEDILKDELDNSQNPSETAPERFLEVAKARKDTGAKLYGFIRSRYPDIRCIFHSVLSEKEIRGVAEIDEDTRFLRKAETPLSQQVSTILSELARAMADRPVDERHSPNSD